MPDETVTIGVEADISQFKKGMEDAKKSTQRLGKGINNSMNQAGKSLDKAGVKSKGIGAGMQSSITQTMAFFPKLDQVAKTIEDMKGQWQKAGKAGKVAMAGVGLAIAGAVAGVVADVGKKLWEGLKKYVQTADPIGFDKTMSKVNESISKMRASVGTVLEPLFEAIADYITDTADKITEVCEGIMSAQAYLRGLLGLSRQVNSSLDDTSDSISEASAEASEGLAGFDKLNTLGDLDVSGMAEAEKIQEAMDNAYDSGQSLRKSMSNLFNVDIVGWGNKAWTSIKDAGSSAWDGITSAGSSAWDAIKSASSTIWDTLSTAGTTAWDAIKSAGSSVWKSLSGLFGGIWDGMTDAFKTVANAIIRLFNKVIKGYNDTIGSFSVDVFGYKIGFPKLGEISELANGGVIDPNNPHAVIVGDNKKEQEVVSPLSTMKQAFQEVLSSGAVGSSGPITINLTLDSRTVAKAVYDPIKQEARRRGITGTL